MKDIAVLQRRCWHRGGLLVAAPLAVAALLLAGLVGSASAAKLVGTDGKVYACYQAKQGKGKAKGSVRLVAKNAHCRRGSASCNWGVAGRPVLRARRDLRVPPEPPVRPVRRAPVPPR